MATWKDCENSADAMLQDCKSMQHSQRILIGLLVAIGALFIAAVVLGIAV